MNVKVLKSRSSDPHYKTEAELRQRVSKRSGALYEQALMGNEPLTPEDLDLRDFSWMPLDVQRLRDSNMAVLVSGDAFRAAVLLWCASWHQVPAASLPNEDRILGNLAGYGRDLDAWVAVRDDALRGFIECSDGRLYHPVVAEKAIAAGEQKRKQRKQTEAATSARRVKRDDGRNDHRNDHRNDRRNDRRDDDRSEGPNDHRDAVQQKGADQTEPDSIAQTRSINVDQPAPSRSTCDASQSHVTSGEPSHFSRFWQAYPRRDGANPRKPAEQRFNSLVKSGLDPEMLIAEAKKLHNAENARGTIGTRFIPQASTWLGQARWSDHAAVAMLAELTGADLPIEEAVKMYARIGHWSRYAGPEPGHGGCRASAELLAKYGFKPDGRKTQEDNPITNSKGVQGHMENYSA